MPALRRTVTKRSRSRSIPRTQSLKRYRSNPVSGVIGRIPFGARPGFGYPTANLKKWNEINRNDASNHLLKVKNPECFPEMLTTNLYYTAFKTGDYTDDAVPATCSWCYTFRTDMFDPDVTNTGVQCPYFDILCNAVGPYNRFRVNSMEMEVVFNQARNDLSGIQCPVSYAIFPSQTSYSGAGTATKIDVARNAQKGSKAMQNESKATRLYAFCRTNDIIGPYSDVSQTQALYSATPAEVAYMNIFINAQGDNAQAETSTLTVSLDIIIKYNVTFFRSLEQVDN